MFKKLVVVDKLDVKDVVKDDVVVLNTVDVVVGIFADVEVEKLRFRVVTTVDEPLDTVERVFVELERPEVTDEIF